MSANRNIKDLPGEMQNNIVDRLSPSDASRFAQTCGLFFNQYGDHIQPVCQQVHILLLHVVRGEIAQAKAMLMQDPGLLLEKGTVTDYSHRKFKDIYAYQYALWSLDTEMREMLLQFLPIEVAKQQLKEHEEKIHHPHGKYYSFEPLKAALKAYKDNYSQWSFDQIVNNWCENIGEAQSDVPAWLANKYCGSKPSWFPLAGLSAGLGLTCAYAGFTNASWISASAGDQDECPQLIKLDIVAADYAAIVAECTDSTEKLALHKQQLLDTEMPNSYYKCRNNS